ncbi:MAG: flagellar export chaperone FlgN [Spirochaetales bacterium]|jgi:hypothetical protein|nr:flagellar export chaperone FlgN [Spirochaetales bacterium]
MEETLEKLLNIMLTENRLLEKYRDRIEELNVFIQEKDWEKIQELLGRLDLLSREIQTMDKRRDSSLMKVKESLALPPEAPFYTVLAALSRNMDHPLAAPYRAMKNLIIQIQGILRAIEIYIRTMGESVNQIISQFFPHQKGKIYARDGQSAPVNSMPLLINRQL